MCEIAGEAYFFNFPRITDVKDLGNHIDEWLEYMNMYGLTMDDRHLRVMLTQTLPQNIQEEISTRLDLGTTLSDLIDSCTPA